jgi:hypothetical protein
VPASEKLDASQQECDAIGAKTDKTWQQRHGALSHQRYRFIRQHQRPTYVASFRANVVIDTALIRVSVQLST